MARFFAQTIQLDNSDPTKLVDAEADRRLIILNRGGDYSLGFTAAEVDAGSASGLNLDSMSGRGLEFVLPAGEELWASSNVDTPALSISFLVTEVA